MKPEFVPPSQLPLILQEGHTVIDVRTPAEFRSVHVAGAELVPLDKMDAAAFCQARGTDAPVYVLCQSGARSQKAAERLCAAGHTRVCVVQGGTDAAIQQGIEVVYGEGGISIDRQVRITAGLLVLSGTLAGAFIHPGFFLIPGFVGAGLAFAGITNTCGMAMALAKCPWNR